MRTLALLVLASCSSQLDGGSVFDRPDGGSGVDEPDARYIRRPDAQAAPDAVTLTGDEAKLIADRPYQLHVPTGYDPANPTPLLILLHGYSADGAEQGWYFGLTDASDKNGFLYAYPDGTQDSTGLRFWNATDACCNFYGSTVDDVAYVNAIIDDVMSRYHVDAKQVFLVGHSNGAFMSHRLACDLAPRIAAIVALAGDDWKELDKCKPSEPVSILQVHGDSDIVIQYGGGTAFPGAGAYPAAGDSIDGWGKLDGCIGHRVDTGLDLDLDFLIPGAETKVTSYTGCPKGIDVQLWTMHGDGHVPALQSTWADYIYTFLRSHPKR